MKKYLLLLPLILFFAPVVLFGQKTSIKLLNDINYKLDSNSWELDENNIVNAPYHFEYLLKNKKRISKLRVRVSSMDYHLKDSVYSNLEIKKRTATGELEELKKGLSLLANKNLTIKFEHSEPYKGFKIMTVTITMNNDKTKNVIMSIGVKVLNDYFVIGVSIENLVNSTQNEAENLLKSHLKKLKNCS